MKSLVMHTLKKTLTAVMYTTIGAVIALIIGFILYMNNKPDLESWHTVILKKEFTTQSGLQNFDEYRSLEEELFSEMNQRIINKLPENKKSRINRFTDNSLSNPTRWPQNWNKTYELKTDNATAGVLMLHGLSDSPYSLQQLGKHLHKTGAWVVGLRVPGHGTVPSGLVTVKWQDMAAAVKLAMHHLREKLGDKPLYIVGYSNGAALAVHYSLTALDDDSLPQPHRLVLLSPAIGVSPAAAYAVWQARIGHWLGLDKLAWLDVLPEYDPYKYQSFAVNAGDLEYQLTTEIQSLIEQLEEGDQLKRFPSTLAFTSAVDATVSTLDALKYFFLRLHPGHHELVIFDINRSKSMQHLFTNDPEQHIDKLLHSKSLPFTLSIVGNQEASSPEVVIRTHTSDDQPIVEKSLGIAWPKDIYSLSHVALPFSPQDPLYGGSEASKSPGITIGNLALHGEKGVLYIPPADMLRQRWNPFYSLIESKTENFLINNAE